VVPAVFQYFVEIELNGNFRHYILDSSCGPVDYSTTFFGQ
jgi:hypothetical protein